MEKTSKPIVAGVLNIITGVLGLLGAYSVYIGFAITKGYLTAPGVNVPDFVPAIVLATAIVTTVLAILPLIGGIYSLQRKTWGLTLAGSIISILVILPLGIPATILTASSKNEFE